MARGKTTSDIRRMGAESSTRGYQYQWLYALRMLRRLLNDEYDGFCHEDAEDYVAWKDLAAAKRKHTFVQVKHRRRTCFLSDTSAVDAVLKQFSDLLLNDRRPALGPCEFVLVVNQVHDCRAAGCIAKIRRRPAYQRLRRAMRHSLEPRGGTVRFERFLRLPLELVEVKAELTEIDESTADLVDFLENQNRLGGLIASLAAIVTTIDGVLTDRKRNPNGFTRETGRRELIAAINGAVEQIRHDAEYASRNSERQSAASKALRDIQLAFHDRRDTKKPDQAIELAFSTESDCARSLEIIHTLRTSRKPSIWDANTIMLRHGPTYLLRRHRNDLQVLASHLSTESQKHITRISIIVSLMETLATWSKVGVYLHSWRGEDTQMRDLYLIDPRRDIVIADLGALRLYDANKDGLLSSEFARGPVLARAMLHLYYGSTQPERIKKSALFRASWNDNVVLDLARWFRGAYPRMDDAFGTVAEAFASEFGPPPIFVNEIDDRFLMDCVNNEIYSPIEALTIVKPHRIALDRTIGKAHFWVLSGEDAQMSILGLPDRHVAKRLSLYDRRRWRRNRTRDIASSVQITPSGETARPTAIIYAGSNQMAQDIAHNVFGHSPVSFRNEQTTVFERAQIHARNLDIPPILKAEDDELRAEQERLDSLQEPTFPYTVTHSASDDHRVQLVVQEGARLLGHLKQHGYNSFGREHGLRVLCNDGRTEPQPFDVITIASEDKAAALTVIPAGPKRGSIAPGALEFLDPGTEKVLYNDMAAINALRGWQEPLADDVAAKVAWDALEAVLGEEVLGPRPSEGLWQARSTPASASKSKGRLAPSTGEYPGRGERWIVTGAPGTGKTRFTADVAIKLIASLASRRYPPPRVVVVAASHFALDNFARVFDERSGGKIQPYRHVPGRRRNGRTPERDVDAEVDRRSWSHYVAAVQPIIQCAATVDSNGEGIFEAEAKLRQILDQLSRVARREEPPPGIPSHQRWRHQWLGIEPEISAEHRERIAGIISSRLEPFAEYRSGSLAAPGLAVSPEEEIATYATFGAPVVVSTVDAFYDLPDINSDLVIFEEASQLSLKKFLKVLTKLARASTDSTLPGIIFSGDARQLAPFKRSSVRVSRRRSAQTPGSGNSHEHEREAPFAAISRRQRDSVIEMTVQHRMRPGIANLVRSLFYADQDWTFAREETERTVWWWDTGGSGISTREHHTRSRVNDHEVEIVQRLVQSFRRLPNDILIVSPYAGQVRRLSAVLRNAARIKTIDGCQGQQAHTVILSFVTLTFDQQSVFVPEPRRMNVAMSRASDELHLVGDFAALRSSIERFGHLYPHMEGLYQAFAPGGRFADSLKPAPGALA